MMAKPVAGLAVINKLLSIYVKSHRSIFDNFAFKYRLSRFLRNSS